MTLVAHKYMPEEMSIEELRNTFAAREHTLDYLAKSLHSQCGSKTLTSYLIWGARGSGKTTLILMLCLRIKEDQKLSRAWLPVRFPEELPGVTSLRDLMAAALHVMSEDGVPGAGEWHENVENELHDEQSLDLALRGLRQISEKQKRRLVLFVENLDLIFDRGLNDLSRSTLRRLLMDAPFMMIIGTAVTIFEALRKYDEAFFNYFCPVPLDRLDDGQVRDVLFRRAEYDGNEAFSEQHFHNQGGIKAISRLTGGNPRLILMLYEALAHGRFASTVETLRSLVDELTPLLKDILEHQFSNQQSKILDALMRSGGTATPSEIARAARLSLNTVTTQLQRLKDMQVVELRGGGKGRKAFYTVPDQLFSTWYQMRYLRPRRRRIEMFVEVLRIWFDEEERLRIMRDLSDESLSSRGKPAWAAAMATEYYATSLAKTPYHMEARETAFAPAKDEDIQSEDRSNHETAAYAEPGKRSREHGDLETAIEALQKAVERNPEDLGLHFDLGLAMGMSGKHRAAHSQFDRVVKGLATNVPLRAQALFNRGVSRAMQYESDPSIDDFLCAARESEADKDIRIHALDRALRAALGQKDESLLDRAFRTTSEAFGKLEPPERLEQIEGLLVHLATPDMKSDWPHIFKNLSGGQPTEVAQRLSFFQPVADILETGDLSGLDPLPQEQREFVQEVLQKFEPGGE